MGCGGEAIPFSPVTYLWEDAEGVQHSILQGEGGEQGDPLMLLLSSLGQHGALEATHEEICRGRKLHRVFLTTFGSCCQSQIG